MDCAPRIERSQSIDALSSMSNIAGSKAVVEAANEQHRIQHLHLVLQLNLMILGIEMLIEYILIDAVGVDHVFDNEINKGLDWGMFIFVFVFCGSLSVWFTRTFYNMTTRSLCFFKNF